MRRKDRHQQSLAVSSPGSNPGAKGRMIDSRFAGLPLAAALGRNDLTNDSPAGRATSLSGFTKGHAPPPDVRICSPRAWDLEAGPACFGDTDSKGSPLCMEVNMLNVQADRAECRCVRMCNRLNCVQMPARQKTEVIVRKDDGTEVVYKANRREALHQMLLAAGVLSTDRCAAPAFYCSQAAPFRSGWRALHAGKWIPT